MLAPFANGSNSEIAIVGSDTIARAQIGSAAAGLAAGTFSNGQESRQRTDLFGTWGLGGDQTLAFAGGTEQGRTYESPVSASATSFSFANATFAAPRALNLNAVGARRPRRLLVERRHLAGRLGVVGHGRQRRHPHQRPHRGIRRRRRPLVDRALRRARRSVRSAAARRGRSTQTRADAGIRRERHRLSRDGQASARTGSTTRAERTESRSPPRRRSRFRRCARSSCRATSGASNLEGSGSFTLPTFADQYRYADAQPAPVAYQRNSLFAALGHLHGRRAAARSRSEGASQNVSGASTGTVTSSGISAIWQVAPAISVRAWTMHVDRHGAARRSLSVRGRRTDRQCALADVRGRRRRARRRNLSPRSARTTIRSITLTARSPGPIANGLRWYAGAEDRHAANVRGRRHPVRRPLALLSRRAVRAGAGGAASAARPDRSADGGGADSRGSRALARLARLARALGGMNSPLPETPRRRPAAPCARG